MVLKLVLEISAPKTFAHAYLIYINIMWFRNSLLLEQVMFCNSHSLFWYAMSDATLYLLMDDLQASAVVLIMLISSLIGLFVLQISRSSVQTFQIFYSVVDRFSKSHSVSLGSSRIEVVLNWVDIVLTVVVWGNIEEVTTTTRFFIVLSKYLQMSLIYMVMQINLLQIIKIGLPNLFLLVKISGELSMDIKIV